MTRRRPNSVLIRILAEDPALRHTRRDRLHERPAPGLLDDIKELIRTHVNAVAEIVSDNDSLTVRRGWINCKLRAAARALAAETCHRNSMILIVIHDSAPFMPSCREIVKKVGMNVNIHEGNAFVTSCRSSGPCWSLDHP